MINLKRQIIKYLIIVISIGLIRLLLNFFIPELFTETIIGEGFTQTKTTFFGLYQANIFNILLAIILMLDLKKLESNFIVIPTLTVISATAGLFFFALIIFHNLTKKHNEIQHSKSNI